MRNKIKVEKDRIKQEELDGRNSLEVYTELLLAKVADSKDPKK